MAPGYLKKCVIYILYPNSYLAAKKDWPKDKVKSWITQAGGKVETKLSTKTTHFVISDEAWKDKHPEVRMAEADQCGKNPKLKIVHAEWLEEVLFGKKIVSTTPHIRERTKLTPKQRSANKAKQAAEKKAAKGDEAVKPVKSVPKLIQQTLEEATAPHISVQDQMEVDQKKEEQRKLDLIEEQEKHKAEAEAAAAAAAHALQEEKRRTETSKTFHETNHICTDKTGFRYDILLVKSNITNNTHEKCNLRIQVWRSNDEPLEYLVNVVYGNVEEFSLKNHVRIRGAPYFTAMRHFTEFFKTMTGVEWNKRVQHEAFRRNKAAGVQPFETKPYRYLLPLYGEPRGMIPYGSEAEMFPPPGEIVATGEDGAQGTVQSGIGGTTKGSVDGISSSDVDSSSASQSLSGSSLTKRKTPPVSSEDEAESSAKRARVDEE